MAPPPAPPQKSPSPSQPSGEVSDLKLQLRQLAGSRAPGADDSKRDLFKRVISYMTVGIDVSAAFSEMVMCSATSDIVLKKMCYLYVGNYARCHPDLALLTINFLQKDCHDEDPMIRGLALRSLCSLRVPNLVEYLVAPLGAGLKDGSSYVRMVAAVGVLKLYHISAATCFDSDFPAVLKSLMLTDPDAQYDVNAIVDRLLQFLEMEKDYVTAETLVSMSIDLRFLLHLLTAAMKCFFKRPPETQKALGAALAAGLADSHQDVHDRALFYYRLLQYDVSVAERVVNPPKQAVSVFADTQSTDRYADRSLPGGTAEIDRRLSISIGISRGREKEVEKKREKPGSPVRCSSPVSFARSVARGEKERGDRQRWRTGEDRTRAIEREENGGPNTNGPAAAGYSAPPDYNSSLVSLSSQTQSETAISDPGMPKHTSQMTLAIDDLLGLSVPAALAPPSLKLNPKAVLDPGTFQRKWGQLAVSISQDCSISPQGVAALTTPQALIRHMQASSIQCIASGGQSPNFKFFFFAQKLDGPPSFFLMECIINTSSAKAQVKIKADDATASEAFFALFQSALSKFGVL
ncbi:hypothetical protein GW17_00051966 [Ensete ventricosum]|nr:hypothetical protein GW17_00051966 [Ensete ventricosum]